MGRGCREVETAVTVSGMWIYPVKSCRGIALERMELGPRGPLYDREWMVVDAAGRMVTQRERPELALVRTRLAPGALVLEAPRLEPLDVPLDRTSGPEHPVFVWQDRCRAVSQGPEAADWLGSLLGMECRLVRMAPGELRQVDLRFARPGESVGFADGFPLLLLSEASLEELNRRLDRPVPMDRFRPNLVVSGCPPHAEDGWRRLSIGGLGFRVAKPCSRCVITTRDQATGERGAEPLRTLATYRREGHRVLFGMNVVHEGGGSIALGDRVGVTP